MEEERS
jgi:hypothetical protein